LGSEKLTLTRRRGGIFCRWDFELRFDFLDERSEFTVTQERQQILGLGGDLERLPRNRHRKVFIETDHFPIGDDEVAVGEELFPLTDIFDNGGIF